VSLCSTYFNNTARKKANLYFNSKTCLMSFKVFLFLIFHGINKAT